MVLPSVPVIPTTASSRLGSPYHQAAADASAAGARSTTSCGQGDVRHGALHDRGARHRPPRPRLDEVVPVDVQPGDRHEERARADGARVVGHARTADVGEAGGADRPAVEPGAAQPPFRRQAVDEPGERRGLRGSAARSSPMVGDASVVGHRRTSRATRAVSRPAA